HLRRASLFPYTTLFRSIELVIVNTPNYTHFEFAKESLEAGKHVLLEKPAVDNLDQLDKLSAISEKTGKKIFFYQNRRYDSHFMRSEEHTSELQSRAQLV